MTLAVVWSLSINGQRVSLERKSHVNSIEINECCDGSDYATITILDKNMEYINDNIYVQDASVSIKMHFVGADGQITFDGYISAIDINFPEDGIPVLTLTCLDGSHVMNRVKKKRTWKKRTRMSVAKEIAQEYGFKFEGDPSYNGEIKSTITQSNKTDIDFLEDLAKQEKPILYMCKLVGDTIIYQRKGLLDSPVCTVNYRKFPYEVKSFNPKINKETMQEESSSSDISTDTKLTDTAVSKGTDNTMGEAVNGSSARTILINTATGKEEPASVVRTIGNVWKDYGSVAAKSTANGYVSTEAIRDTPLAPKTQERIEESNRNGKFGSGRGGSFGRK